MVDRLTEIETYYDAVPRSAANAEEIGPFTLFVNSGPGWSYYARPSLGAERFGEPEVQRVRARQRHLGIPENFEWVAETSPALRPAGLSVLGRSATAPRRAVLHLHPPGRERRVLARLRRCVLAGQARGGDVDADQRTALVADVL